MAVLEADICRICYAESNLVSLLEELDGVPIKDHITKIAKVEIDACDILPKCICKKCTRKLRTCVQFIQKIESSDKSLRECLESVECWEESIEDEENVQPITEILCEEYSETQEDKDIIPPSPDSIGAPDDPTNSTVPESNSNKLPCTVCGKLFPNKLRLMKHRQKRHAPKDPKVYICQVCGKVLASANTLRLHNRMHTGEKPYECPFCGKKFAQASALATHKRLHTGENPFSCSICMKEFKSSSQLRYHLIETHAVGEKSYLCSCCGKKFAMRCDLLKHEDIHSDEKHFACEVCGTRFHRIYNLQRHMLRHKDAKPFTCKICDKPFRRKYDVTQHMKLHNKKKKNEE